MLTGIAFCLPAKAGTLHAGAARVDITPTQEQFPFTATGDRKIAPYIGVHDPVYARALVLDDGATQVAILVVEVTAIPRPESFQAAVAKAVGMEPSQVLIAASHTHSVPLVNYHADMPNQNKTVQPQHAREIERVMQGAVEAARQAKANLRPARFAFTSGEAFFNINRDDPHGPSDKSLDLLRVVDAEGKPIAVLANYSVPSIVMMNNYRVAGGIQVTGDLLGVTAKLLESQPEAAPVVLFAPGMDGDQNPILTSSQPKVGTVPAGDNADAAWGVLDALSRRLANATLAVLETLPKSVEQVKLIAAAKTVECPGARFRQDSESKQLIVQDRPPVPIPLSVIRINDLVLAGVAGNLPTPIGLQIKSGSAKTVVIGVTAGSIGYILPDAGYTGQYNHTLGGTPLKSGCAEKAIVQGIRELMGVHP